MAAVQLAYNGMESDVYKENDEQLSGGMESGAPFHVLRVQHLRDPCQVGTFEGCRDHAEGAQVRS